MHLNVLVFKIETELIRITTYQSFVLIISDLGLFSTKSLVEANADHPVEVRTQVL